MRRRWKLILFAIVLPLAVIGGCGVVIAQKVRPKDDTPRTAEVKRGDVVVAVRETGYVEPVKRVDVKSKVAGKILELAVDEGDVVTEGQLIARLDVPEVEAQRDQIKAQRDGAKARLEQARLACEQARQMIESQVDQAEASLRAARFALQEATTRRQDAERIHEDKRRLFEMGGYVSENDMESAKAAADLAAQQQETAKQRIMEQEAAVAIAIARRTECEVNESRVVEAEASVRQVEETLAEVETRLSDAVIRAPMSGVVIARHLRERELITAVSYYGGEGAPIVTVGDLSTMLVKIDLNEVDVDKISHGLQAEITVDALPDARYTGRLTRIARASEVYVREPGSAIVRFPIEVTVEDADIALRPGMTANVKIICESAEDVLWVPNDAVFEKEDEEGKKFVTVVPAEEEAEKEAEDREVTTGLSNDSRTEIASGVEEEEKVELGKGIPERKKFDIRRQSEKNEEEE
jgi:RND family efflux transporter MFP subunit